MAWVGANNQRSVDIGHAIHVSYDGGQFRTSQKRMARVDSRDSIKANQMKDPDVKQRLRGISIRADARLQARVHVGKRGGVAG